VGQLHLVVVVAPVRLAVQEHRAKVVLVVLAQHLVFLGHL